MTRSKTRNSQRVIRYANRARKISRDALLSDLCKGMYEAYKKNNNRLPYGHLNNLLKEVQPDNEWMTRNMLNKAFIKYRSQQPTCDDLPIVVGVKKSDSLLSELSNVSSNAAKSTKGIGRPIGTTEEKKKKDENTLISVKNEISQKYAALKGKAARKGTRVKPGTLKDVIKTVKSIRGVTADISPDAIRRRIHRKKLTSHHVAGGQVTPLMRIEPVVVEIILQMARIRQCLCPSKGLELVNSLIKGTPLQEELVQWKSRNTPNDTGTVGVGYWRNFLKRHKTSIVSKRGQKYELNRQNWTTYANFVNMYTHTMSEMVDAGVAIKLDKPVWMDRLGNICSEEEAIGCKVFYKLVRPDMCLCGDEVGGNLSMKGDGHIGGKKLLTARGKVPQKRASTRNRKFTLIGLTAFTGEPVMCILIIEGKNPKGNIEAGIDISVTPVGDNKNTNFIFNNSGPGKYYPGGPECTYNGKKVPAFIRWHESASITTHILVEALQTLDSYNIFNRTNRVKPFLILDGHKSRLELPFLQYINTPKDHWVVCIGVPYGTALWQVGDSKEQNGSFNIAMTKSKQELLEKKDELGLYDDGLVDTDLMPLINKSWSQSFARVNKNRNALADRGWNPLNQALLLHDDLRATMTRKEKSTEYNLSNNIIIPKQKQSNSTLPSNDSHSSMTSMTGTTSSSSINNHPFLTSQPDELNFNSGQSLTCLKAMLSQDQLHAARERIREDGINGKTIKEQLQANTRLSAGIVFKSGSTRLGKTVFQVCKENHEDKIRNEIKKIKKDEIQYNKNIENAKKVFEKKGTIENMTIRELTIVCKPLKNKSDGPMPNKKEALISKYKEWVGRPPPLFNAGQLENSMDDAIVTQVENDNNDVDDLEENVICEIEV